MLISNQYSDSKLYRGVRYYDGLPLSSDDLHEYSDTVQRKTAFFMNNLVGSGTLNDPACKISATGISLDSPSIVLVDGDIALIHSEGSPLVPIELISQAGYTEGIVCVVGWYQHLTHSSTLRAYGGVNNSIIENDLVDEELGIQLSTRYQLRWDIVLLDAAEYASGSSMNFSILSRDAAGESLSTYIPLTMNSSDQKVRIIPKPTSMDYAISDLYIVPILSYTYSNSVVSDAKSTRSIQIAGSGSFSSSEIEPTGEHKEGDIWYKPSTKTFKFYIDGLGYVSLASNPKLARYTNEFTFSTANTSISNILLDIGISLQNAILDVYYEGLLLYPNVDYTVDMVNNQITLLDFTTRVGDKVTFVVTGLVETT